MSFYKYMYSCCVWWRQYLNKQLLNCEYNVKELHSTAKAIACAFSHVPRLRVELHVCASVTETSFVFAPKMLPLLELQISLYACHSYRKHTRTYSLYCLHCADYCVGPSCIECSCWEEICTGGRTTSTHTLVMGTVQSPSVFDVCCIYTVFSVPCTLYVCWEHKTQLK